MPGVIGSLRVNVNAGLTGSQMSSVFRSWLQCSQLLPVHVIATLLTNSKTTGLRLDKAKNINSNLWI